MVRGVWEFAEFASALTGSVIHVFLGVQKNGYSELPQPKKPPNSQTPLIACADLPATRRLPAIWQAKQGERLCAITTPSR